MQHAHLRVCDTCIVVRGTGQAMVVARAATSGAQNHVRMRPRSGSELMWADSTLMRSTARTIIGRIQLY